MKRFCFCFTVRTGCLFVAYITGICSGICCIGSVLRLLFGLPVIMQNDDYQGQFPFNPVFYVFGAVFFAVHTVASFILVPAIKQSLRMYMIPVTVILIIDAVLSFLITIALLVKSVKNSYFQKYFIGGALVGIILFFILIYFLLIACSYYQHLFQNPDEALLKHPKAEKIFGRTQSENSSNESTLSSGPTTV